MKSKVKFGQFQKKKREDVAKTDLEFATVK